MTIQPFGEQALLITFESKVNPAVNDRVVQLSKAIEAQAWPAVTYQIPAYSSLTIGFKGAAYAQLYEAVTAIYASLPPASSVSKRRMEIPVSYASEHALDREKVCNLTSLSWEEVVKFHSEQVYRVYMLGFLPGFPYLGRLPDVLEVPRLSTPRKRVPALSVGITGWQTGIYPFEAPGGWQIIGQAQLPVFMPESKDPFLLQPGDEVVFSVSAQ